jgi:hypothetical protein
MECGVRSLLSPKELRIMSAATLTASKAESRFTPRPGDPTNYRRNFTGLAGRDCITIDYCKGLAESVWFHTSPKELAGDLMIVRPESGSSVNGGKPWLVWQPTGGEPVSFRNPTAEKAIEHLDRAARFGRVSDLYAAFFLVAVLGAANLVSFFQTPRVTHAG